MIWVWRRGYLFCLNNNRHPDCSFLCLLCRRCGRIPSCYIETRCTSSLIQCVIPPQSSEDAHPVWREATRLVSCACCFESDWFMSLWRAWVTLTEGSCERRVADNYVDLNHNHISFAHLRECWPEDEFQFILALCKLTAKRGKHTHTFKTH